MKQSKAVVTILFCAAAVIGCGQTPPAKTKPDNTKVNQRDRNAGEATADQPKANATDQERAVDKIVAAGFSNNDISVLLPDKQSSKELAQARALVPE